MMVAAIIASSLPPGVVSAAPAGQPTASDLAAFDRGFRAGQDEFNRHNYLEAAKVWTTAAASLPETEEHKDNRRAIYEYIAEAYEKAVELKPDEATLREGLVTLDAYASAFVAAHPADTLPERVTKARADFRSRLDEIEAERRRREEPPEVAPAPAPVVAPEPVRPPPKPWKGLAIGGGVAVAGGAAMLAMFAVGYTRAKSAQSRFDAPENACDPADPTGMCADINSQGKTANSVAVAGLVAAPLLLGAGIGMLVIATRRKANRTALVPMFGKNIAGVVWHTRF
jgi:hypothetical protein